MKLVFTGDLSCTGIFRESILLGQEIFSESILSFIKSADSVICNFEGAATDLPNLYRTDLDVRSPKKTIQYFTERNIFIYNLANNHIFDCGEDGFVDTRNKILSEKGIYFGAGQDIKEASNPQYLIKDDVKIALIGICHEEGLIAKEKEPGIFCDKSDMIIKKKINEAKKNSNWVILNYHGGEEYTRYPMPKRRQKLFKYLEYGVDVIVAHHSHVVQGYEKISNKYIFYSLGNFIFDIKQHRNRKFVDKSVLLRLKFTKDKITHSFTPILIGLNQSKISLDSSIKNEYDKLSDFTSYNNMWEKECYRVVCVDDTLDRLPNEKIRRFFKQFPIFILLGNLLKIKRLIKGDNFRPVLFGAFRYHFKIILSSFGRND